MSSIGTVLKSRREEKGLSLAQVNEATKIAPQTLAALEENRYDAFPNRVYTRAFIRDYANYLGLDGAAIAEQYEAGVEPSVVAPAPRRGWRRAVAAVAAVVVLAGIGYGGFLYMGENPPKVPHLKPPTHTTEKPKPGPRPTNTSVKPTPTTGRPTPTSAPLPAVPAGMTRLQITATTAPVWVRVKRDGKTELETTLARGQSYTTVGKRLSVLAGAAYALEVKVNGKSLGMLGKPKQSVASRTFP